MLLLKTTINGKRLTVKGKTTLTSRYNLLNDPLF